MLSDSCIHQLRRYTTSIPKPLVGLTHLHTKICEYKAHIGPRWENMVKSVLVFLPHETATVICSGVEDMEWVSPIIHPKTSSPYIYLFSTACATVFNDAPLRIINSHTTESDAVCHLFSKFLFNDVWNGLNESMITELSRLWCKIKKKTIQNPTVLKQFAIITIL